MNWMEGLEPRQLLAVGVSGFVYRDLNGDDIRQTGEPGLANRTVFHDANFNNRLDPGEISAVSDSSGAYRLANVPAGAKNIRQIVPDLWKASSAIRYVNVPASG